MSDPYIAEIRIWANTYNPMGWAYCNGAPMQITTNQTLYAVIGQNFGGSGNTFNLPNLMDNAPIGVGTGSGLTNRQYAHAYGEATVTLTTQQIPSHKHTLSAENETAKHTTPDYTMLYGWGYNTSANKSFYIYKKGTTAAHFVNMHPASLKTAGAGAAHVNMQPCLAMIYCIAIEGVFPTQS